MIFRKSDVKSSFYSQWSRYVPAVLAYAEGSGKRSVGSYLADMDKEG